MSVRSNSKSGQRPNIFKQKENDIKSDDFDAIQRRQFTTSGRVDPNINHELLKLHQENSSNNRKEEEEKQHEASKSIPASTGGA